MEPNLVLSRYFSVFMLFTVALALVFQLPLVLLGLSAGGIVDAATLRKYRRHCIVGAFLLSAICTPPEPYSQVLMALPTVLLFELGVILVALRERRQAAPAENES
jgi:sec-independent protein translocase protein TatC